MNRGLIIIMKRFIVNWGYECRSIWNNKVNIIKNTVAVVGAVTTIYKMAEILNLAWITSFISNINIYVWFIAMLAVLTYNICKFRPVYKYTFLVKNVRSEITVTLQLGDIFSSSETMVIPVNTAFDTSIHKDIVKPESVQGQFQKKFYRDNIITLDNQLNESLNKNNIQGEEIDRNQPMKSVRYALGTIAELHFMDDNRNRKAYYLASSDTNRYGKTENVNMSNYMTMLGEFWLNMSKYGHTEDNIVIPVPCSGNAGIPESLDKLVSEIVNSYKTISQEYILTRNLTIYIYPKELRCRQVTFDSIAKHVEVLCEY